MRSRNRENSPWKYKAMAGLWRANSKSDLPIDTIPQVNDLCKIRIASQKLKNDRVVFVEYLPALVYLNGFETADDLTRFRVCKGMLTEVTEEKRVEDCIYGDHTQDVTLKITSVYDLKYFASLSRTARSDIDWGDEFLCGEFGINLLLIGKYISLSWSSESYTGAEYLLIQTGNEFDALYCNEYMSGESSWTSVGRVELPNRLSGRLLARVSKLSSRNQHWFGKKL